MSPRDRTVRRVVLTGGTRGIGQGLARALLERGHRVCITGRTSASVARGCSALGEIASAEQLVGQPCEVADLEQVEAVWARAAEAFGGVDLWINNAGAANPMRPFAEVPAETCRGVVETNLLGVMFGCRVAVQAMQQQGHGQIYNVEGFGSDGRIAPGLSVYGATKRSVTYFTDALIAEHRSEPVNIGHLSPGIVVTDLLRQEADVLEPEAWARLKRTYNILGDRVETVTPWLADALLADYGKHGSRIAWLTTAEAAWRFFAAFVLRRERDLFSAPA